MSAPQRPDPIERYLQRLPEALPRAGTGDAIVERHLRRRRLRRWAPPLAAAAAIVMLLLYLPRVSTPPPPAVQAAAQNPALAEVRSVDRRLQAAYLTAGSEAELDALWQQRRQAVARLEAAEAGSVRLEIRL